MRVHLLRLAALSLGVALSLPGNARAQQPSPPDAHEQAVATSEPLSAFALDVPDPNPFSQFTRVSVQMPLSKHVRLVVYDQSGRKVALLFSGTLAAGRHTFTFVPDDTLPNGLYRILFKTPSKTFTQAVKLLR